MLNLLENLGLSVFTGALTLTLHVYVPIANTYDNLFTIK